MFMKPLQVMQPGCQFFQIVLRAVISLFDLHAKELDTLLLLPWSQSTRHLNFGEDSQSKIMLQHWVDLH